MNVFSVISIIACTVYLYVGFYAFNLERNQKINRLFLLVCISFAIWSFAFAFVYVTKESESIWMEISAIGWCSFSSLILHLVLLFTENRLAAKKAILALIYLPTMVFFYISVVLFWKDDQPSLMVEHFFYTGDFLYHFSYLLISILLISRWGIRSPQLRKQKQAKTLVIAGSFPFLLNLVTQTVLPHFGITIPALGHVYGLVTIMGAYYAMMKYRLFSIEPKLLIEEILQEMMDLVIVVSPEGKIIKTNNSAEKLLGYKKEELYGKPLESIMKREVVYNILNRSQSSEIYRLWEVYFIKKNQNQLPVNVTCSFILDGKIKDTLGVVVVGHDITLMKKLRQEVKEHKEAKEKILYMAEHDSLTGLANRKYFYQSLHKAVERSNETDEQFAVLFLDVDDLKLVNDTYGHEAGDELLCTVGERIKEAVKDEHLAARIGGDEFTFLIFSINGIEEAKAEAKRILEMINRPMSLAGKTFHVRSSAGISIFPHDSRDGSELVKKADTAMYRAKGKKKAI